MTKKIFCYQHNIEKYDNDTAGLTFVQHGAYRRLLDFYYRTSARLPADLKQIFIITSCQNKVERDAIVYVVSRYFSTGADGYLCQVGAEKEMERILGFSEEQRRKANLKHLKDKQTRLAAAVPDACRDDANHQLSTINKERKKDIGANGKEKSRDIPADWRPNEQHREKAKSAGFDCDSEAEKFKSWHTAKGNRFVNWDAAFYNWIARTKSYMPPKKPANRQASYEREFD